MTTRDADLRKRARAWLSEHVHYVALDLNTLTELLIAVRDETLESCAKTCDEEVTLLAHRIRTMERP